MYVREALRIGLRTLAERQVPSAELAAELLLMHVLGHDRSYLYTHPEVELSPSLSNRYFELVAERSTGKPTQYITGHQEFWELNFEVTPDVLIPRPETEHLVEAALELTGRVGRLPGPGEVPPASRGLQLRIVDVGTGSGCIVLALASEFPNATLFATDVSPAALAVATRNAARLGMTERVTFLEGDLLSPLLDDTWTGTFDLVVSNPPYVGLNELSMVQREVRDFEPKIAWGGSLERGDEIYARLFPQALRLLKAGGYVAVEIGYNRADAVRALLARGWTEIEVRPDLAGIPRVVIATKAINTEHPTSVQ